MNYVFLILHPLAGALTGWLTVRLSIYLLFRPARPKRILGITIQGIFPKRQQQWAGKLGKTVARELMPVEALSGKLKDPEALKLLMPGIEAHIDAFLRDRLKEKIPVLAMFLSDSILETIKASLMEEIEALLPLVIGQATDSVSSKLDIEKLVSAKVAGLSSASLEAQLTEALSKELGKLCLLGACIGLVFGLMMTAIAAGMH